MDSTLAHNQMLAHNLFFCLFVVASEEKNYFSYSALALSETGLKEIAL